MRRRLAGGLLVLSSLLLIAGACSTFGEDDVTPPVSAIDAGSDASSTDAPDPLPEAAADAGSCGKCEGECLPADGGCAPFDPAPALPTDGTITALAVSGANLYLTTTARGGSLWRLDIPNKGKTNVPVMMVVDANAAGVATSGNYVHSSLSETPSGKTYLGHVVKGAGAGAVVTRSDRSSAHVAANDDYVYAATTTELHTCDLLNLYNACTTTAVGVEVSRLAASGAVYCIHGRYDDGDAGAQGVYCGTGLGMPSLRGAASAVDALAIRGQRVFWAGPAEITSASVTGAPSVKSIAAAGVTALAVDTDELVVATGARIFRCPKDDCPLKDRQNLTLAPGIERLALSDDHVYFTYGVGGSKRLGRVPRRP